MEQIQNNRLSRIQDAAIMQISLYGIECCSVKQLARGLKMPGAEVIACIGEEKQLTSLVLSSCFSKLNRYLALNPPSFLPFDHGMRIMLLQYLRFRQIYPMEEDIIQKFLMSPSRFYQSDTKAKVLDHLSPFIKHVIYHHPESSDLQALAVFKSFADCAKSISKYADYVEMNDSSKLQEQFHRLFWSKINSILGLPLCV